MSSASVTMRRFVLRRTEDVSGTSGTGAVAEGVEYSDGAVGLHWLSQLGVHAFYANLKTLLSVHGHEGKTTIEWIDT